MKVLVAGDFSPKVELSKKLRNKEFHPLFSQVRPYIKNADIAIVNFESTIAYNGSAIKKHGPSLMAPAESIEALKYAGFRVVTLANNHFYDYGENGLCLTLDLLDKANMMWVGAGPSINESSKVLYVDFEGKKLAIINCCENEFSIATKYHGGCNPLNPIKQYYEIKTAREEADFVLVITHGGHEHYQLPSTRMQDTYRFFVDAGADAVINHHQHCFSGMEFYNGRPIFYGLGNFLFETDKKEKSNYEGYMVILSFEGEKICYELVPYFQCDGELTIRIMAACDKAVFYDKFDELNKIISNRCQLETCQEKYYSQQARPHMIPFEPYRNNCFRRLFSKGWLPSFLDKNTLVRLINYIDCEAHNDILRFALHKKFEKNEKKDIY